MEKRLKIQLSRVESRGYKYRWERTKSGKNSKIRWSSNHYEKETIGTWSPLTEIESKRIRINTEIPRSAVQWNIWARKRHGSNLSNRSQFSDLAAKRGGGGQRFDQRLLSINRRSSWAERHMKPDFFASPKSREEGIGGGGGGREPLTRMRNPLLWVSFWTEKYVDVGQSIGRLIGSPLPSSVEIFKAIVWDIFFSFDSSYCSESKMG